MIDSPISHFYSFTADRSDGQVFAVPDASLDILFLCDNESPKARLCGSTTAARLVEIQKGKRYFGVRFRPGYIPNFIDADSKSLIDAELSLNEVIQDGDQLLEKIAKLSHFDAQVQRFIEHFQSNIQYKYSAFGAQVRALITHHCGDIRIADLEKYTGYSSRYISKVFIDNFGLSPKSYALILRFQHVLQRMIVDEKSSLTDLASEQGYADQSHFLREFKRFAAQAPSLFMQMIKANHGDHRVSMDDEILTLRSIH